MKQVLDLLMAVNLDIHLWSARKKLTATDLGGAVLPPEDLASLGSKRICNPDDIKKFATLKSRAISMLDKHGVRFLSGWAIPDTKTQMLLDELNNIKAEFNQTKIDFLNSYDDSVQDWIARHPQWSGIIAGSTVSKEYVSSRLSFNWQMFKVIPPFGDMATELHECTDSLGLTLFDEISKAAKDTWQRCFEGKSEITRKALSPLKSIHQKLVGLSFLEPRVTPIEELIAAALNSVPQRGAITDNLLTMLRGLICLLQNPATLLSYGQHLLDGQCNQNDVLHSFLQQDQGVPSLDIDDSDNEHQDTYDSPTQLIESHGLW